MRTGRSATWLRVLLALAFIAMALTAGTAIAEQPTDAVRLVTEPAARTPGRLIVDGKEFDNPNGCLTVRKVPRRIEVENGTGIHIRIYLMPGCKGGVTTVVEPGTTATGLGASVQPH